MARGKGKGNAGIINKPVAGSSADDILEATAAKMNGGDGDDYLSGSDAIERINAGDGDDTIYAGGGDDTIFGNDGTDTLVLDGSLRDAILSEGKGNSYILTTDAGGTDTIKHIEILQFNQYGDNGELVGTQTYYVGVNNGVFTSADVAEVSEDGSIAIDVTANDFDFEGDAFGITAFDGTSANGATVTLENGRLVYNATSVAAYQSLAAGESTTDSFTYSVTDAAGNTSTETVTVTVQGANDAPEITGGDISGDVKEDEILSVSGTMTATDVDVSDVLTWSVVDGTGAFGNLNMNADGTWTYTLDNDAEAVQSLNEGQSETESFTIEVTDGTEVRSETIEITVNGASDGIPNSPTYSYGSHHIGSIWGGAQVHWTGTNGNDWAFVRGNYSLWNSTFLAGDSDDRIDAINDGVGSFQFNLVDGGAGNDILNVGLGSLLSNSTVVGGEGDDEITASVTNNWGTSTVTVSGNTFDGGVGNDTIKVQLWPGSNDTLAIHGNTFNGGEGEDTLIIDGNSGDYTLTLNDDGTITMTSAYGDNTLSGVENIVFNDATIAAADVTSGEITAESVFTSIGFDPSQGPQGVVWSGGMLPQLANDYTAANDVVTLHYTGAITVWRDWYFANGNPGYDGYGYDLGGGEDVMAVRLGGQGGDVYWSDNSIDLGEGNDIFALDMDGDRSLFWNYYSLDSEGFGEGDFLGGAGEDTFLFDVDATNYVAFQDTYINSGTDNDTINISLETTNVDRGVFSSGNRTLLGDGDDSFSISTAVVDGSTYNLVAGLWNGGAGNDTMSFQMSGDAAVALYDGFSGHVIGATGDDTFIFNIERFATYGTRSIDGGADYDTLVLEMGTSSDYTLTVTNDLIYQGVLVDLTDIEEIQFSDTTVFL